MFAAIDPYILAFSSITVIVTIWMGFRSAKTSKTASDFFVAGRSVSVGWNASAISGEYLSAASFMGVAGMVMSSGYDALWYPVCYACGYLFLLLFIAGPLRRFGAYTIPDFAEGRYDSPVFRKIAVVFVLFIGFFYTMPQMKGAGTTLAYIFPGLPYWVGVALVGAVITLNVALGGMKGITLVQAVQYWIKMFAISVPIFVLMAVYGNYNKQLQANFSGDVYFMVSEANSDVYDSAKAFSEINRKDLPGKAPADSTWLNPFGPLTTKAANAAKPTLEYNGPLQTITNGFEAHGWFLGLQEPFNDYVRRGIDFHMADNYYDAMGLVVDWARERHPSVLMVSPKLTNIFVKWTDKPIKNRKEFLAEISKTLETNGVSIVEDSYGVYKAFPTKDAVIVPLNTKPYSLLYTYSLIIALVCGTAGLPHILVRFYTNPDGVAAKRTTMWVMILIGVFYVFPPVFGVMGRNLLPELYNGVGAKGTDKIVLELPRILNSHSPTDSPTHSPGGEVSGKVGERVSEKTIPWGSILSGITCAGAFAAFMSTFSGLLVSMTGALAHDVYGRMLRPKSTPAERMAAFKICAVVVGGMAVVLGCFVEPLEINFMVGQAFAIAAASYFPLLFMSVWWRGMTMRGAALGMLTGGLLALGAAALTNFSTLALDKGPMGKIFSGFAPLNDFWAHHPLLRILCEQPAIWTVPLAITLMIVVSKLTAKEVPNDIRMKMLVLHAPEKLGLKQEYIQEHQPGH